MGIFMVEGDVPVTKDLLEITQLLCSQKKWELQKALRWMVGVLMPTVYRVKKDSDYGQNKSIIVNDTEKWSLRGAKPCTAWCTGRSDVPAR